MVSIPAFSARLTRSPGTRYAVALGATAAGLLLRLALGSLLGEYLPYVMLFPAVAFSAWFCGVGPSFLAIVVGVAATRYWLIPPAYSLSIPDVPYLVDMAEFGAAALVIVAIAEVVRRNHAALYDAQVELEDTIKQRTRELNVANQSLGELSARLMHLQDEERRRIARELHDSVGQTLAALSMNLASVRAEIDRLKQTTKTVEDSAALVDDMSKDIRTISYLLHPPLLDEAGLSSALTWYIEGFSERSKIEVQLDIPEDFARMSRELETAAFRVVQECLTNIHRHSGSGTAKVRMAQSEGSVQIVVEDKGKGIPPEKQSQMASSGTPGVGVRGMRERVRQLGGDIDIHSESGKGTRVVVRFPLTNVSAPVPPPDTLSKSAAASL